MKRCRKKWPIARETASFLAAVFTVVGVCLAIIFFYDETADRHDARMIRAWQVLISARDTYGNAGQVTRLETLYHGGENITGLSVGCPKQTLNGGTPNHSRRLRGYAITRCSLKNGQECKTEKFCMFLADIKLTPVGNEGPVNLSASIFNNVYLYAAQFPGAILNHANFTGAELSKANFLGATLAEASLNEANMLQANLSGTNLTSTDLKLVRNLTQDQLDKACADPFRPPRNVPNGLKWRGEPCTKKKIAPRQFPMGIA